MFRPFAISRACCEGDFRFAKVCSLQELPPPSGAADPQWGCFGNFVAGGPLALALAP